ncbi:MAG: hypothetical protein E6J96_00330 [Methanobacteriota archaeon]|nr:MAG: hypothetical protein E6J96_00330 [Euryarchaeota archaeon]
MFRRRRTGAHGARPARDHRREVEVPPRQRSVYRSGEDLGRSGRSTLTSSSFSEPFSVSSPSRKCEHPSAAVPVRRVPARESGLIRTTNLEKDAAIAALNGIEAMAGEAVHVTTVGTSGTIRAATRKYLTPRARARRD